MMFDLFAQASTASIPRKIHGRQHRDARPRRLRDRRSRRRGPALGAGLHHCCSRRSPSIRTIDLNIAETWKNFAGSGTIPYLGVAAHVDWAEKNPTLVPKLYATYKEAANGSQKHPDEAAKLIVPKAHARRSEGDRRPDPRQRPARHERDARPPISARKSRRSTRPARRSAFCRRCRRTHRSTTSR